MNTANPQIDLSLTAEIKLYYDLYVPENLTAPAPLLLAVHGYGGHKRYMMREARLIAPEGFVIASIQAPFQHFRQTEGGAYKVGFGWLTDYKSEESVRIHHDFARRLIGKLATDEIVSPDNVFLFGFSQACALNFRFAFTYPEQVRGVVGVCGGIPSDLAINESYKQLNADVLYVYGDADEFYPLPKFENFARQLENILPNFQAKQYGAQHEITGEMRVDIKKWLADRQ